MYYKCIVNDELNANAQEIEAALDGFVGDSFDTSGAPSAASR